MLETNQSLLLLIDVQIKLFAAMHDKESLSASLHTLIKGIGALNVPILVTEQYPTGLGSTIPEIAGLLSGLTAPPSPIDKLTFSCWGEQRCRLAIDAINRRQILLAGIETHVCVYQTAVDLIQAGYNVHVVSDAVQSRKVRDRDLALQKMRDAGAQMTGVEIALFELLRTAEAPQFKEISKLVR